MGDSRSKYYDDLDDYNHFCETLGVEKRENSFYEHEDQLLKELGFTSKYDYYASLRKAAVREKKIDSIINPE